MEHYQKGEVIISDCRPEIPMLDSNALHMKVKQGSKVRNLVTPALEQLNNKESCGQVLWSGTGKAISKTISCTEIIKKNYDCLLHQITRIYYNRTEEYYEPKLEGLERLRVVRNVPAISILLSRTEPKIPETLSGYQTTVWSSTDITHLSSQKNISSGSWTKAKQGLQQTTKTKRRNNNKFRLEQSVIKAEKSDQSLVKTEYSEEHSAKVETSS